MIPFIYIINKDGYLMDLQGFSAGYIKNDRLKEIIAAANMTLNYNLLNNITDLFIDKANADKIEMEMNTVSGRSDNKLPEDVSDLYLIHDTISNCLKIGKSKNVSARFTQIQTATSNKLQLLFCLPLHGKYEKQFHDTFSELRLSGEWFSYSEEIIKYFNHCL